MPTPAEVRRLVNELPDVGKLVHLGWRMDTVDEQEIAGTIFKSMRRAYEHQMTQLAQSAGCRDRRGLLDQGPTLSDLRRTANQHAAGIIRTYNAALARQIQAIQDETPTANRQTYSARLRRWDNARAQWKESQIALMTHQTGVEQATSEFIRFNPQAEPRFEAMPKTAAEPICQGLIDAGEVDAAFVQANPFPIHINCNHVWTLTEASIDDCNDLFLGQPTQTTGFGAFQELNGSELEFAQNGPERV